MSSNKKLLLKEAIHILDSDDELPDSYNEENEEAPAYLNDSRFDHLILPWLENCKPVALSDKPQQKPSQMKPAPIKKVKTEQPIIHTKDAKSKILISQGILSMRDLFFVKSVEDYCSESTLIWFIESLKSKAVPDRFHKSCLAKDFCHYDYNAEKIPFDSIKANYYLSLVYPK